MSTITARFVVKDVTDENGQIRVVLRAKFQGEGANSENPILFPDAECPEQMLRMKVLSNTTNRTVFQLGKDVTAALTGPA